MDNFRGETDKMVYGSVEMPDYYTRGCSSGSEWYNIFFCSSMWCFREYENTYRRSAQQKNCK